MEMHSKEGTDEDCHVSHFTDENDNGTIFKKFMRNQFLTQDE